METTDGARNGTWPPNPPDPAAWVDNPPWDRWAEPPCWRDDDGWASAQERQISFWFFCIGMILWEIQEGFHPAEDVLCYPPPGCWREQARVWFEGACAPPPPRGHKRKAAWRARQAGIAMLREDLAKDGGRAPR
jgi:hypothetical protein